MEDVAKELILLLSEVRDSLSEEQIKKFNNLCESFEWYSSILKDKFADNYNFE